MTTFNPALSHRLSDARRAGSLSRTVKSNLQMLWHALECHGQRHAAHELALTADRIQASSPELAAQLRATARSLGTA